MLASVFAVSDVLDLHTLGLNDDAYDDDPEDPGYEGEPIDELEGKSYRPSLIMLNPDYHKHKI